MNEITLRPLMNRLVYEVRARQQPTSLFDARTGEIVEVTPPRKLSLACRFVGAVAHRQLCFPWTAAIS